MNKKIKLRVLNHLNDNMVRPTDDIEALAGLFGISFKDDLEGWVGVTDDDIFKEAEEKWGNTHTINKVWGVTVDLRSLPEGVSVVYGDGKSYHFQITEK